MCCVLWRRLQCLPDDLGNLSICNAPGPASAILVRKAFNPMLGKPPAPLANGMLGMAKLGGDFFAGQTIGASQDDPAPV